MRWNHLALIALLLPLAGCLADDPVEDSAEVTIRPLTDLSEAVFDILPVEETWIETATDGKRIHNAVYRPDTDEPVPVFINFSPYWGDTAEEGGDAFADYMINEYVPRGYAVVLSAIRGTGHSEGCFQIGGDVELQDTYDVIDFFANEPWSTGKIGAGGKSYDSTTQNGLIAKMPHEALETIFHVSGISDMYRYNYRNGLPYGQGTIFNSYYYLQGVDEYGVSAFDPVGSVQRFDPADEDPESVARVADDAACAEFPAMQASGVGSGAHGLKDAYWQERAWTEFVGTTAWDGSIFFVHGLQDWNVKPDHILPWITNLPDDIAVKGWMHQWVQAGTGHVYPMRDDWNLTMLRWLDHHLKDIDTGIMGEPAYDSQGTDGVWRHSDAWPPGAESITAPVTDGATLGPYPQDMRFAGEANVTVTGVADGIDPAITVVLASSGSWINEAVLRGIYREGLEQPSTVTPGDALTITTEFYPMDFVLPAGETITVRLGVEPRHVVTTPGQLEAFTYEDVELRLPSAAMAARDNQPVEMACFTC